MNEVCIKTMFYFCDVESFFRIMKLESMLYRSKLKSNQCCLACIVPVLLKISLQRRIFLVSIYKVIVISSAYCFFLLLSLLV